MSENPSKKTLKNAEVFHVKKKKKPFWKWNSFWAVTVLIYVENLILIAYFFISKAYATSDVGNVSAYFHISQICNRLGLIKLLN